MVHSSTNQKWTYFPYTNICNCHRSIPSYNSAHMLKLHEGKCVVVIHSHLSNRTGQDLDDLVLWCGYDTLPVYLNDAVPNTDASPLCYATSHQTADLQRDSKLWIDCDMRTESAKVTKILHVKCDLQCHPLHWSQADTWDLASWWSPWWPADSEQCWALHIFGFSSPKKTHCKLCTQIHTCKFSLRADWWLICVPFLFFIQLSNLNISNGKSKIKNTFHFLMFCHILWGFKSKCKCQADLLSLHIKHNILADQNWWSVAESLWTSAI